MIHRSSRGTHIAMLSARWTTAGMKARGLPRLKRRFRKVREAWVAVLIVLAGQRRFRQVS